MPQQSTNTARVRLVVDRTSSGDFVASGPIPRPDAQDQWSFNAGWGTPTGEKVLLVVEYLPTPNGPADVEALAITKDFEVRLPLSPDAEGVSPERVSHLRRRDGKPLSRRDLGKLGLADVYKALGEALGDPVVARHLGEKWGAVVTPRPGRRGRSDLYYALTAQEYVLSLTAEPDTPIRHMTNEAGGHVTADELRARLRRARERGLLTSAPPGRPGGELTEKAERLLQDAGLSEASGPQLRAQRQRMEKGGERGER